MVTSPNPRSAAPTPPLADPSEPVVTASLRLEATQRAALLRLHVLDEQATRDRLGAVGVALPPRTGERSGGDPAALCLRPGEWLLFSEARAAAELADALRPALAGLVASLLDSSDACRLFRLRGEAAPWLLGKLSGLDFLGGSREGAHGTRTRLADIPVILGYDPADPQGARFDLVVDRSLARHLWARLADAAPHAEELYQLHGVSA